MGEQLVKEKKLGLEILPLNSCQAYFSIKSSKHDIFINLLSVFVSEMYKKS